MRIQAGDTEKTIRAFFQAYLVERNLEKTVGFFLEDIQWVGTGKNEIIHGLAEAKSSLAAEFASEPAGYRIVYRNVHEHMVSVSTGILLCEMEVVQGGDAESDFCMEMRVTALCRATEDGCRLVSLHASTPSAFQQEQEFFPLRFAQDGRRELERRLSERSMELMGKSIPGGIMGGYLEPGFPLYYINDRMLGCLGYTYVEFQEAVSGGLSYGMHPDDREWVNLAVETAFSQEQEYDICYRMLKKDGSYIWVKDIGQKCIAEDGRPICLSVVQDVTAEVEKDARLREEVRERNRQTEQYDWLFQSVLCGIVQYRLDGDNSVTFKKANREAIRIFGYDAKEFWEKADWDLSLLIASEDRPLILEEVSKLKQVGDKQGYEYRLRQKNGNSCWIIGSAEIIRDVDDEILVQSVFLDIDVRKRAELQNRRLSERIEAGDQILRLALEHTSTCEFYFYPQTALCLNPERTCRQYHCKPRYTNMPFSFAEEYVTEACREDYCAMFRSILSGRKTATAEFSAKESGVWCRATLSVASSNDNGKPTLVVGLIEDITKEKETLLALEEARSRDHLTGLYVKDTGITLIRDYMEKRDPEQVCAIMLLDMDDFERVNTEEGSIFADAVLQDVAGILRDETNRDDILVRLGGDEFLLFVKDCDKARATVLGPRIAERVRNLYGNKERSISVSIGMCVTAVVDEYSGLYRCAESSLLYVKENCKGSAACYLDTSNALGAALTTLYANAHLFNTIDSQQDAYRPENLVDFALELLGKSKKLDDAISLLLARIGIHYHLDRVSVVEANPEYMSFRYAYQWARDRENFQTGQDFYLSPEEYAKVLERYSDDGIFEGWISSIPVMPSCLQAAVWNQGSFAGSLVLEARRADIVWTSHQKKLVQELSKLLSSFVMKARADAISQAKTEFLSRMSHEIRTPMNAISGMATIAKSVLADREKTLDCLNKIETATSYLNELINDILDMSRIESGKIELSFEPALLEELLQRLNSLMLPQAETKGVSLTFFNKCSYAHALLFDVLRLNQVLINIIGNAVKFTPRGGSIQVTASTACQSGEGISLCFSVKDNGIGISRDAQKRVFKIFEQERRSTASQYGGTGLGLAISSRLVQMMGGVLEVESEPGRGSDFFFTIPVHYGKECEPAAPVHEQVPSVDFGGKRILIAEDNELNREIATAILELQGFTVESAENGQVALDCFAAHEPGYYDAILMDIRMPSMDGLEATRRIRTLGCADSRTIPIIAMTANAFDEDSRKSLESGMNGHLTKPIDVARMVKLLQECISKI